MKKIPNTQLEFLFTRFDI